MRSILTLSSLALLLLLVISTVHAQCSNTVVGNFALPAWGSDGNYQKYGQYNPYQPGLSGNRLWQINLCQPAANAACQANQLPLSYIYELNGDDSSSGSCEMGLSTFSGWTMSYVIDTNGNSVPSINATFTEPGAKRMATVSLICGDSPLAPVPYFGKQDSWQMYPNNGLAGWMWDIVFSTNLIAGLCPSDAPSSSVPTTPPPSTTLSPSPTITCQLPSFNGTVRQWVPSAPELNGPLNWQVSPCAPTLPTCNPTSVNVIESFVFESTPSKGTCSMQLNVQATNWTQAYGGINALFTNLAGNRVANVTVSCGPIAELQAVDTAPDGQGWNTHLLPNSVGQVWVWDMWFSSSLVPGC